MCHGLSLKYVHVISGDDNFMDTIKNCMMFCIVIVIAIVCCRKTSEFGFNKISRNRYLNNIIKIFIFYFLFSVHRFIVKYFSIH